MKYRKRCVKLLNAVTKLRLWYNGKIVWIRCHAFFNRTVCEWNVISFSITYFMELPDNLKVIRGLYPMKMKAGFTFDILSQFCATLLRIYSLIGSQSCARRCSHSWPGRYMWGSVFAEYSMANYQRDPLLYVTPPGQQNTMPVWCRSGSVVNLLKGTPQHGCLFGLSC